MEIHSHLKHPGIIQFFGFFWDAKNLYYILELGGKDLFHHLRDQMFNRYSEGQASQYIYQVAKTLEFLHAKNIIHRDLKPENLCIKNKKIKLFDFGWSIHAPNLKRTTVCGTMEYMPPEMLRKRKHGKETDLWCLGVLTFEMLTGTTPFYARNDDSIQRNILKRKIRWEDHLTKEARHFIDLLLRIEEKERLTLNQVFFHPFITKFNY